MKRVLRRLRAPLLIPIMLLAATSGTFSVNDQFQSAVDVLKNAPINSETAQFEVLRTGVAAVR
jgi:hypothetical protein